MEQIGAYAGTGFYTISSLDGRLWCDLPARDWPFSRAVVGT